MNSSENSAEDIVTNTMNTNDSMVNESNSAIQVSSATTSFPHFYESIRDAMAEVEIHIAQVLSSSQARIDEMFSHSKMLSGKRMRPALTLLCGQACGAVTPNHIVVATVMELIHTASLVHDDILDEADLRRHEQTINARWDNELAVLLGDLVVTRAMKLAAGLENLTIFKLITQTAENLCEGELLQVLNRGSIDVSESTYYSIIKGKTASLIECSCRLGAMLSDADEQTVERFANFGLHLGTAFQIVDDLLDVSGNEQTVGKNLGQDAKKQKATLPVIYALQCVSEQKRGEILSALQSSDNPIEILLPWLKRTDAIGFAQRAAEKEIQIAIEQIQDCPVQNASSVIALDALQSLAKFVLARKY